MEKGKETCRILKAIRRQIARMNGIRLDTPECQYQGECTGTCPRCEAEVRYLEQQLDERRAAGKAITLLGISAGFLTMNAAAQAPVGDPPPSSHTEAQAAAPFTVKGIVKDREGKPLPGAMIKESRTDNGTLSDSEGKFSLTVQGDRPLSVQYVGMASQEIPVNRNKNPLSIVLYNDTVSLMGEIPVEKAAPDSLASTARTPAPVQEPEYPFFGMVQETMPEFQGGMAALKRFIEETTSLLVRERQVSIAKETQGKGGRVIVQFTIAADGRVTDPKVVRGLSPVLDRIALELLDKMPPWKPGTQRGKAIAIKYTLPVNFKVR